MARIDFLAQYQSATPRDYLGRVNEADKAACAEKALRWDEDYWDGERRFGYGGYTYDGRWRPVAEDLARHYGLRGGERVLDVGCGKAFLLYELTQVVPGLEVAGLDISDYAIRNAKPEVRDALVQGNAARLPWPDGHFDFVLSLNTLHNLRNFDLDAALKEIQRVGGERAYVCVESFRTEREKVNLLYWQLTCRAFMDPDEWVWTFDRAGYRGDHGFIFFE